MHKCSRCYGCMAKVTSDIHDVAHTYANPIVVSVVSATGRAYTMLLSGATVSRLLQNIPMAIWYCHMQVVSHKNS